MGNNLCNIISGGQQKMEISNERLNTHLKVQAGFVFLTQVLTGLDFAILFYFTKRYTLNVVAIPQKCASKPILH